MSAKKTVRKPKSTSVVPAHTAKGRPEDDEAMQLRRELAGTKAHLNKVTQEYEVVNEELQALNEELKSSNEEMQLINEEMKTAEEELQSTNEELTSVNDELQSRNEEITQLNNDLFNILRSVEIPIIILGSGLQIRRFNDAAARLLNLIPSDAGRPLSDIRMNINIPELGQMVLDSVNTLVVKEKEVQEIEGRWYSMTIRPYKTVDNRIDGVLMTLVDINDIKQNLLRVKQAYDYASDIVETVRQPLLVLSIDLKVITANSSFYENFLTKPEESEGRYIYELGNGQWNIPDLRKLLLEVLPEKKSFYDFEVVHEFPNIGRRTMVLDAREIRKQVFAPAYAPTLEEKYDGMVLLSIEDITERKKAEEALRESEKRYRSLFENMLNGFAYCRMLFEDGRPQDFIYLEVNSAFEKLTGLKNVAGKKVSEVIPGIREAYPVLLEIYGRVALTGRPENFEIYLEPLAAWFFISVYSIETGYFAAVFDNITERKRAENITHARLQMLSMAASLSATHDETLQKMLDEIEKQTNSTIGFYHFLDADQETLSLQAWSTNTLQNMCTAEGKGSHYNISRAGVWVDCIRQRGPVMHNDYASLDHRKGLPPGHAAIIREMVVPIFREGRIVAIIGVGNKPADYNAIDVVIVQSLGQLSWEIFERIRAADELQKAHAEVELRTQELELAYKDMESFNYSVSHDLRAPLRIIDGLSDIVLKDYQDKLDDEGKKLLNSIRGNTVRMDQLVMGLLELSKAGRQGMSIDEINMEKTVSHIAGDLKAMFPQRNINVDIKELPPAHGDITLIRQVLTNLLSNAVKFTKDRDAGSIEVGGRREGGENVYYVKDNGVGFDMEYAGKLFKVFQRLHSAKEYEGIGIGLSIVDRIIKRHGGRAWAEAKPGAGASFYFTLPRKQE